MKGEFKMNYKSEDLVKITGSSDRHLFKIGETVRLKEYLGGMNRAWKAEYLDGHDWWYVCESDMTPTKATAMPQKIVITTDGKTTLARLFDGKTMVKRAEAKCAPSDVFDFGIGAELAVKRLMGAKPVTEPAEESEPVTLYCVKDFVPGAWLTKGKIYDSSPDFKITYDDGWKSPGGYNSLKEFHEACPETGAPLFPLVRRPAKVGELVYIDNAHINDNSHIYGDVHNGAIFKVGFVGTGSRPVRVNCNTWLWEDEYLVLDGYHGDQDEA